MAIDPGARRQWPDMWWIVHIEGGPRRVNHAAVAVGEFSGQEDLDLLFELPWTFLSQVIEFTASAATARGTTTK